MSGKSSSKFPTSSAIAFLYVSVLNSGELKRPSSPKIIRILPVMMEIYLSEEVLFILSMINAKSESVMSTKTI